MMNILELFSGSGIFSQTARERGHTTFEIDIITNNIDIMNWDYKKFPRNHFDIIWSSPPCVCFSMASLRHHIDKINNTFYPRTMFSFKNYLLILKTWEIIMYFKPKFWFIENPKAIMKKLAFMPIPKEVWYCQYGEKRAKPTDIFTNTDIEFKKCFNNNKNCHHEKSPRGSNTGTQGLKSSFERAKLPKKLCIHIIKYCEKNLY